MSKHTTRHYCRNTHCRAKLAAPVAAPTTAALLEAGFIVNAVTPDALRLAPPLILTAEQADTFVAALPPALDRAAASSPVAEQGPARTLRRRVDGQDGSGPSGLAPRPHER